jgi:hypothetical protein
MKVFVVLVLVLLAAATAFAFGSLPGQTGVAAVAVQVADGTSEPATLLVSGSLLLGLAGAVKKFTL